MSTATNDLEAVALALNNLMTINWDLTGVLPDPACQLDESVCSDPLRSAARRWDRLHERAVLSCRPFFDNLSVTCHRFLLAAFQAGGQDSFAAQAGLKSLPLVSGPTRVRFACPLLPAEQPGPLSFEEFVKGAGNPLTAGALLIWWSAACNQQEEFFALNDVAQLWSRNWWFNFFPNLCSPGTWHFEALLKPIQLMRDAAAIGFESLQRAAKVKLQSMSCPGESPAPTKATGGGTRMLVAQLLIAHHFPSSGHVHFGDLSIAKIRTQLKNSRGGKGVSQPSVSGAMLAMFPGERTAEKGMSRYRAILKRQDATQLFRCLNSIDDSEEPESRMRTNHDFDN